MSQDDDFELLNQRPFFGWEEARRDEVMGRAVYQQAANIRAIKATQAADAARMQAELAQLSGSVENRLGALTRSFGAFVELDAVRLQLAAFPENAKARRLALTDLMTLRAGRTPAERPDIEGYWLPAAMAALQPGGGIDHARASLAVERDPAAAPFLLVARALLGAGPQVVADAVLALAPQAGEWDEMQQQLWRIVVAGGFGPHALDSLLPTLQPVVWAEEGWEEWLGSLADPDGAGKKTKKTGKKKPTARRFLEQLGLELGEVLGAGHPAEPDGTGSDSKEEDGEPLQPQPAVTAAERAPVGPGAGADELLLALARQLIEEGDGGERALLERAELLRLQIANPGEEVANLQLAPPPRRVVDMVRELAVDDAADLAARRQAWRVLLVPIDRWLAEVDTATAPSKPEVRVSGQSFLAGPDGVDQGELRRVEKAIAKEGQLTPWNQRAPMLIWAGAALAVLGVVLIALTSQWGFFLLVLLGGVAAVLGFRVGQDGKERVQLAENRRLALAREVERATQSAATAHAAAVTDYEAQVEALETYRGLRRQIG